MYCNELYIILNVGEATVTLTTPSSLPCFVQTYKLTCTHPVLDTDTLVRWERNGIGFGTSASTTHHEDRHASTATTLTINVTREEFNNAVYTFRCFTYDGKVGFNDSNRVISNEVTVDPPGEYVYVETICICSAGLAIVTVYICSNNN